MSFLGVIWLVTDRHFVNFKEVNVDTYVCIECIYITKSFQKSHIHALLNECAL